MFNPQLDIGLEYEFEGKMYRNTAYTAKIFNGSDFFPSNPITEVSEGDTFMAFERETGDFVVDADGAHVFKAKSGILQDEFGFPYIKVEPVDYDKIKLR